MSLVFVSYAYSGWNAAAYVVGEMRRPERLARALVGGTLLVPVLYVLVNFVILRVTPTDELSGTIEVGFLAAERILGPTGGRIMAVAIACVLASTVSAMVFLGPRVIRVMGEDTRLLRPCAAVSAGGAPVWAIGLQLVITLTLLYSGAFDQVLVYAGFALMLMTMITVAGVFRLRRGLAPCARSGGFRTPGYPYVPLVFLATNGWILGYTLLERPVESLLGRATVSAGALFYFADRRLDVVRHGRRWHDPVSRDARTAHKFPTG